MIGEKVFSKLEKAHESPSLSVFFTKSARENLKTETLDAEKIEELLFDELQIARSIRRFGISDQRSRRLKVKYSSNRMVGKFISGFHLPFSNTIWVNAPAIKEDCANEKLAEATLHISRHLADSKKRIGYTSAHVLARYAVGIGAGKVVGESTDLINYADSLIAGTAARLGMATKIPVINSALEPAERTADNFATNPENIKKFADIVQVGQVE